MNKIIITKIEEIKREIKSFEKYKCVVILCKYNGGKSSVITNLIHSYFGEDKTYYVTFTDQSKPNFIPRKSKLEFDEIVEGKVVVFDEISDDLGRDVSKYLKKLIDNNLVIILSNFYGGGNDADKEIKLFMETESVPLESLFVIVKE